MKNDEIVFSEEMKLELGESLGALGSGQVMLKRLFEKADAKIAEQDTKIAIQQRLIDSHEHRIEMLEAAIRPKGKFDA
jgi:hypothetical protein